MGQCVCGHHRLLTHSSLISLCVKHLAQTVLSPQWGCPLLQASLVMVTLPLIHSVSMSLSDVTLWWKSNSCCPSTNTRNRLCSQWISTWEQRRDTSGCLVSFILLQTNELNIVNQPKHVVAFKSGGLTAAGGEFVGMTWGWFLTPPVQIIRKLKFSQLYLFKPF